MFRDRHNVGAGHFRDRDATIGLVCSIEVDMIRSNASCDRQLQVLRFGKTFRSQVAGMEAEREEVSPITE